jgi:uncharacterized protein (DUF433 family)
MALNHKQRCVRRREIAEFVRQGGGTAAAAKKFGVTIQSVRLACREFGVPIVARCSSTVYAVIAELQQGGTITIVADKLGITRQRVSFVRKKCLEYGISLKRR